MTEPSKEPRPEHIIFIPESGELPDVFADSVNSLPSDLGLRPRIAPWSGGVEAGVVGVEKLLDKHELRRIVIVGAGMGAAVALRIAQTQPRRITHLVLDSPLIALDPKTMKGVGRALKLMPGFMFRKASKQELLSQVDDISGQNSSDFADVYAPTLIMSGSQHPTANAGELAEVLPNAQSIKIEGAGVRTYRTHPHEFGAILGQFLRGN